VIINHKQCCDPVLSILICHLPDRVSLLNLLDELKKQTETKDNVEILVCDDPRGSITIGGKRNLLLNAAKGTYAAFIDDDDMVSPNYIQKVLNASRDGKDCIGIVGIIKRKNWPDWAFRHSITVGRWCKDKSALIYFRTPNHLNPVKLEIAKKVMFKEIDHGEDKDYSERLRPLLKNETFIEHPIYFYLKV